MKPSNLIELGTVVNGFNAGTQRQEDHCEIGASLGYKVSSRIKHLHTQLRETNQRLSVPRVICSK